MSSAIETNLKGNAGVALQSESFTWNALLASIAYAMTLHSIQVVAFVILRERFSKIYRPRTYLVPDHQRTRRIPSGLFAWVKPLWLTTENEILQKCGLDACLFLRFIRMMLVIFLPLTFVVIPILTPINRVSGETRQVGSLSHLSISNIAPEHAANRLWAHWALGILVVVWVCLVIHYETITCIKLRQKYLYTSGASRGPANTILVGNIPKALLSSEKLEEIFSVFHGGVRDVYVNTDTKGITSTMANREKALIDVEVTETKLIARCLSRAARNPIRSSAVRETDRTDSSMQTEGSSWDCHLYFSERATLRLPIFSTLWWPSLPFVGRKVDRIHYRLEQIARFTRDIESSRTESETNKPTGSAFIQFHNRIAGHLACQAVIYGVPHRLTPCIPEVSPQDVIWSNLTLSWQQRWLRTCISLTLSIAFILFYAVPVAFTSLLANLDLLAVRFEWLSWLLGWPSALKSVVQGILPPALLQVMLLVVPLVFRGLAYLQGAATYTIRETRVQNWYFVFLFTQVFLVVSISGSLLGFVANAANDPKTVSAELAETLPRAANYFMSYVLIKALTGSASALLQPFTLLVQLCSPMLDISPRQKWQRLAKLSNVEWSRTYPPLTNIAVIGISFSVISPVVLGFVTAAFSIYWIVYRYNILYVYRYELDSSGRFFVTAINHLFTGLYVLELSLIGIFFITTGPTGELICIPQMLTMLPIMLLTISYQYTLNNNYGALMQYLPVIGDHLEESSRQSEEPKSTIGTNDSCTALTMQLRASISCPTVWIPRDPLGISRSELSSTTGVATRVKMTDEGACIDRNGDMTLMSCPPSERI